VKVQDLPTEYRVLAKSVMELPIQLSNSCARRNNRPTKASSGLYLACYFGSYLITTGQTRLATADELSVLVSRASEHSPCSADANQQRRTGSSDDLGAARFSSAPVGGRMLAGKIHLAADDAPVEPRDHYAG